MVANAKLTNDLSGESVDVTLYRIMIGCLLYLTASHSNIAFSVGVLYLIASHSDIVFSVGVCFRFQSNPKISHLNAFKRIIKYVSETCDYGFFYSKESNLSFAGFF